MKRHARAWAALRESARNDVECPDPVSGRLDDDTRMMNRSTTVARAVDGPGAADAVRILSLAAVAIEEQHEDGCLSMLAGEALQRKLPGDAPGIRRTTRTATVRTRATTAHDRSDRGEMDNLVITDNEGRPS